ncbi:hypothetical protein [Cellvibrio sp. KY-GH-1]|uniref:hypothetical protein n=1 Tax=Cellvibrio sp. KY-GH-1 TaxID=2303332 RepID=UPI0012470B83|nr:hypothetical protein [Cellvibrio sp. KY-GH-1]
MMKNVEIFRIMVVDLMLGAAAVCKLSFYGLLLRSKTIKPQSKNCPVYEACELQLVSKQGGHTLIIEKNTEHKTMVVFENQKNQIYFRITLCFSFNAKLKIRPIRNQMIAFRIMFPAVTNAPIAVSERPLFQKTFSMCSAKKKYPGEKTIN